MLEMQILGYIKTLELFDDKGTPTIRMKVDPIRDYLEGQVIQWVNVIYNKGDAEEVYTKLKKGMTIFAQGYPLAKAHRLQTSQAGWVGALHLFVEKIEIC